MLPTKPTIYLDYAAATPLHERVFVAMTPYLKDYFYNPSSPYLKAKQVKTAISEAKDTIGRIIGAKASEIVITAGATESINMAIWGVLSNYSDGHAITCSIEHQSVLESIQRHNHTVVSVQKTGLVDVVEIEKAVTSETVLISIGYVNNELGSVQPVKAIAALISKIKQQRLQSGNTRPLYFHCDASQAAGYFDINVARLGIDLLTLNAAKCYGPKQTGLLWIKTGVTIRPLIVGGGQERGLRSGTESAASVIGFACALQLVERKRKILCSEIATLRDELQKVITEAIPQTLVNGSSKRRAPNYLHLAWPYIDGERLVFALDEKGIMIATGSACAANKGTRSHVLTATGMKPEIADGSIRITLGMATTRKEITEAAEALIAAVRKELSR